MEFRKDLLLGDLFGELPEKHGGQENNPVFEVEYLVEIVLLHVYRMSGAGLEAHAAVNTGVFVYRGQTVLNAYRLGRA